VPVETKRSFCRVCHAACPLDVDVETNRVVAVRGVTDDPIFVGYTCIEGRQLPGQLSDPARLRSPLLRSAGHLVAVSGPELFDHVADVLRGIVDRHGPRSVASYTGTGGFPSSTAVPDVPQVMDRWYTASYTNYTPAVVEAVGDVYAEWEVFWELARRLGSRLPLAGGDFPFDRRPTDDDMIDLIYAGARMPLDEIRRHRGVVHEHLALVAQPADDGADAKFTVAPEDLMAELTEVRTEWNGHSPSSPKVAKYPFRLVSRRLKAVLNSLGTELPGLRAKSGTTNCAYLNPDDMTALGIGPDELVEISSPTGSLVAVAAAASDGRRGAVSMAHCWGDASLDEANDRDVGAPINRLVSTVECYDRTTGMPVQSAIPVRVGKATAAA
jgi:anaerobic selenocysteine-containing dehydrogenase